MSDKITIDKKRFENTLDYIAHNCFGNKPVNRQQHFQRMEELRKRFKPNEN